MTQIGLIFTDLRLIVLQSSVDRYLISVNLYYQRHLCAIQVSHI